MNRRGLLGKVLRSAAQHPVVRRSAAIAAVGSKAAASYQALAREDCPVANIPYCCDMQMFFDEEHQPATDRGVRFLYCGQLIDRKGVDLLVESFLTIARFDPGTTLTLVGEGPKRDELTRRVPPDLAPRIRFLGFESVEQLPRRFSDADVLVLPSRHDGWGVVVNQALAASLAIVCSDAVGAADDLVEPQRNGLVFARGDGAALTSCLRALASNPALVTTMGRRSRELALTWTPQQAVDRWYDLCCQVVDCNSRPRP
jgi:glycosyltransferase involved in cell wall biosynthesis